ncbi:glucokinase [Microbispora triticiradicis]|uniref:Glucokinase n=1 Tax=Microbispora triticiradicis TaxID=2200763 RepID=A0ABX9LSU8_9ACTN|nr:glucokinase [Microbispora triticiradicis]RGA06960.1 glucokinase [Microbispora triticiradicis]GLW22897.1 glucokinase [Microbispora amethystogenes]
MSLPWLVADVGGTNARFGLVTRRGGQPEAVTVLDVSQHLGLADAVAAYLADHAGGVRPGAACLAIAGPVDRDRYRLTNAGWSGSVNDLGIPRTVLLNDFEALAISLPHLAGNDLVSLGGPPPSPGLTKAVLGPGTGLGVAGLVPVREGWLPVAGEGGHVAVPVVTDLEMEIVRALRADGLPYVDAEHLLSGTGLPRLHRGLALVRGVAPDAWTAPQETAQETSRAAGTLTTGARATAAGAAAAGLTAAQITASDDPLCVETVEVFLALLGGFAGGVALTFGARGGVYLGGGVLPRLAARIPGSAFRARFETTAPALKDYAAAIPTSLIVAEQPALTGAAAWLAQRFPEVEL